ncbi:MAG: hypothetical protein RL398_1165 [Planctomycetota bacterium]
MRLLSATVRNYRVHRETSVTFDRDITLLVGPNEVGKSTFLEAVHRGLLLSYKRGGKELAAMSSDHGGVPEVEVRFEAAGAEWHVRKVFRGSSGSLCQLRNVKTGKAWEKDEAETELMRLLRRESAPRSEAELGATWSHLWAWQGRGGEDVFAVPDAEELDRALAKRDSGGDAGGLLTELEVRLLEAAERAVAANWPPTRQKLKADGEAARKQEAARDLETRLETAKKRLTERADQRARLAALRARRTANQGELQAFEAEVAALTERVAERAKRIEGLAGLRDKLRETAARRATLADEQTARDAVLSTLLLLEPALAQAAATHAGKLAELERAVAAAKAAADVVARTDAQREIAARKQAAVVDRRALRDAEARDAVLQQTTAEFALAKAAHDAALAAVAAAVEVSPSRLAELRKLDAAVVKLESQLDAAAARIVHVQGPGGVRVDGEALAIGAERRIDRPTRIEHQDGTVLEVLPGGSDVAELRDRLRAERVKFDAALLGVGASDMAAAVALEERWRSLRQKAELTAAELKARPDPTKELVELRAKIAALRERVAAGALLADEETEAHVTAAAMRADADYKEAIEAHDIARRAIDAARERAEQAKDQLAARKAEFDRATDKIDDSRRRYGADEELAAAKVEAARAVQELEQRIAELAGEEAPLQAERAELQARQRGRDGLRDERGKLGEDIARIEGSLQGDDEDTADVVERLAAERDRAVADAGAATLRADADKLLLETLLDIKGELRARREAPYLDACAKYLGLAFGAGSRLHFDDDKDGKKDKGRIGSVDRAAAGLAAHSFEVLSCGGKELVALATRLAMAEVLAAERGEPVPVVLDDALTNVDPTRAKRLGGMLAAAAAADVQVVVASCDDQRIGQWLAGAVVHLARG